MLTYDKVYVKLGEVENKGWIKLYRKLLDNDLLRDPVSLQIFIWLLLKVDNKGKKIIGRFWVSKELGLKPSTFRDGLYRLRDKYKITTLETDNKKTIVWIVNWGKYQLNKRFDDNTYDNGTTTGRHSYRIKNKEYIDKEEKILLSEDARKKINQIKKDYKKNHL